MQDLSKENMQLLNKLNYLADQVNGLVNAKDECREYRAWSNFIAMNFMKLRRQYYVELNWTCKLLLVLRNSVDFTLEEWMLGPKPTREILLETLALPALKYLDHKTILNHFYRQDTDPNNIKFDFLILESCKNNSIPYYRSL